MIIGSGIDITEIARLERLCRRLGDKVWERILAPAERRPISNEKRRLQYLAGRFAAKEAASKALGTGLGKVGLHDLIIDNDELGAPVLTLQGHAAELAAQKGVDRIHLTLSHSDHYAVAHVILEKTCTAART
ncbi:holo-[acyl-carrier protein] synthase [Tumebacillus sp. BK434]|uniref:holo-ACP synthase n=1 Tax=Tumebacillus sp. BK434 TaxID=2512169 RepID=UPI00104BDFC1|nr:holo-ACP synthase [Tumebacillus sp. BK434]TCP56017.1 holo-[acyl-carrier protein] synthase [Tumebacillus sp. BK434]